MALKSATGNVDYIKWGDIEEGSVVKGFFLETKPSKNYPDQMNHYVETLDGKKFGLNGSGSLDKAFESIRQGWYVEVTYTGKFKLESGKFKGKECHQFDVKYDDERIHPLYSGDASARKEVEYKNSEAPPAEQSKEAPPMVRSTPTPTPTAVAPPAPTPAPDPTPAPAEAAPPAKKRSLFS